MSCSLWKRRTDRAFIGRFLKFSTFLYSELFVCVNGFFRLLQTVDCILKHVFCFLFRVVDSIPRKIRGIYVVNLSKKFISISKMRQNTCRCHHAVRTFHKIFNKTRFKHLIWLSDNIQHSLDNSGYHHFSTCSFKNDYIRNLHNS